MLAFIPDTSRTLAALSASKLDFNKVSASVLKVASILTAVILADSSESMLLCNTPSAASLALASESILL